MVKKLIMAALLTFATAALAHTDNKFHEGPNGGHIIDAGGGAQHWELVAKNGNLTLYVTDSAEKPVNTAGGAATAKVLIGGKIHAITFQPAGGNTMTATGDFIAAKGMKVIVKTEGVGGQSFQARLTPLK